MDRTNVGNAKVAGLLDSITMTGHEYNAGVVSWQRFILMAQINDVGLVFSSRPASLSFTSSWRFPPSLF